MGRPTLSSYQPTIHDVLRFQDDANATPKHPRLPVVPMMGRPTPPELSLLPPTPEASLVVVGRPEEINELLRMAGTAGRYITVAELRRAFLGQDQGG